MEVDVNTRIIDLTVGELKDLMMMMIQHPQQPAAEEKPKPAPKHYVYGIAGIAQLFNCSMTTANRIKASGKINRAISQCGRMITVDADLALELMKR